MMKSLLMAACTLAAGCAGMSDTECRSTSWYELGERDALIYGLQPQIEIHAHQCSRHGVPLATQDYMAGWMVGKGERIRRAGGEGCCSPQ